MSNSPYSRASAGPLSVFPALLALGLSLTGAPTVAEDYTVGTLKEGPPKEAAAALSAAVAREGVRVVDSKKRPVLDLWFRTDMPPVDPKGVKVLQGVSFLKSFAEGTLLGVARYHRDHHDIRDQKIGPGVYTIRYAIQPQDGDHLGVSDTRDFVLLSPAKKDTKLEPLPTRKIVDISTDVSGTSHPATLYLISTEKHKKPDTLPAIFHDEEWGWHIVDFELPLEKTKASAVRLGLVVAGKIEEF